MLDVAFQSAALAIGYLVVGLIVGWIVLAWLDRRLASGRSRFAEHFRSMQASPVALAVYLGLRFVGICWIVAAFARG